MSNLPLLIFDLDGTLIDSKVDIAASMNHAFKQEGYAPLPEEKIYSTIGFPLRDALQMLTNEEQEEKLDQLVIAYREHYIKHWKDNTKPFPGVVETLESLSEYPKAIATTKKPEYAVEIVHELGLAKYFLRIQGTDTTIIPAKPDPALLNMILTEMNHDPSNALMIGDTDKDIMAGKNAGVKTCAVTYGIASKDDLMALRPEYCIDTFSEVLVVVKKLTSKISSEASKRFSFSHVRVVALYSSLTAIIILIISSRLIQNFSLEDVFGLLVVIIALLVTYVVVLIETTNRASSEGRYSIKEKFTGFVGVLTIPVVLLILSNIGDQNGQPFGVATVFESVKFLSIYILFVSSILGITEGVWYLIKRKPIK
ncbi:MAG: HAD family hydrolase [bacterium]